MVMKGQELGPDPDVNAVTIPHEDLLIGVQFRNPSAQMATKPAQGCRARYEQEGHRRSAPRRFASTQGARFQFHPSPRRELVGTRLEKRSKV